MSAMTMRMKGLALVGLSVVALAIVGSAFARATFSDGTYRVGSDIKPGTYRTRGADGCYWARLHDFSGGLTSILANDNATGPAVVTILRSDRGFETNGCGNWTSRLTRITKSKTRFGAGTYIVGLDIAPGTYRSRGGNGCYWERMKSFVGDLNSTIANDNPAGPVVVTISRSDKGFKSDSCAVWSRL